MSGFFNKQKIRTKLVIANFIAFSAILIIFSSVTYFLLKNQIEQNVETELSISTKLMQRLVKTSILSSIRNHLKSIANSSLQVVSDLHKQVLEGKITEEEARKAADKILKTQVIGKNGYVYCLDSKGFLRMHPHEELVDQDVSNFAFVKRQTLEKNGFLMYEWKNPGEVEKRKKALYMLYFEPWDWIISASFYVEDFKEIIDVEDFREGILGLKFRNTGYSYLIDYSGNCLVHPILEGQNISGSKDSSGRYFIREMTERKSGKIIYPWQNPGEPAVREKLVIFEDIPELGWIIASSCYLDELYHPLVLFELVFLGLIVLTMIILIPVSTAVSYSITKPLTEKIQKIAQCEKDDFSLRLSVSSEDEVGELARSFNGYMDKIESYKADLQEANAKLAEKVETLKEMLPICSHCKNVRTDTGYWEKIESFFGKNTDLNFSHSICPECVEKFYPEHADELLRKDKIKPE